MPNKQHLIHVKVNKALIKVGDKVHAIVDKEKDLKHNVIIVQFI